MNAETMTAASKHLRFDRAIAKAHLLRGGSLTLLLRDKPQYLNGVRLRRLVKWMPGVGDAHASRLLLGFNHYDRLDELSQTDFYRLLHRVADHERRILQRIIEGD